MKNEQVLISLVKKLKIRVKRNVDATPLQEEEGSDE